IWETELGRRGERRGTALADPAGGGRPAGARAAGEPHRGVGERRTRRDLRQSRKGAGRDRDERARPADHRPQAAGRQRHRGDPPPAPAPAEGRGDGDLGARRRTDRADGDRGRSIGLPAQGCRLDRPRGGDHGPHGGALADLARHRARAGAAPLRSAGGRGPAGTWAAPDAHPARDRHLVGHRQGLHLWRTGRPARHLAPDRAGPQPQHLPQARGIQPVRGRVRSRAARPDQAVTPARTSRPGWTARLLLLALCVALMITPQIRAFPVPQAELVIDKATFSLADGQDERVALPHIWPRSAGYGPTQARYELDFTLGDTPQDPVYITVPAVRHHLAGTINGRELIAVGVIETWLDPSGGTARRFRVQEGALKVGVNRIVLTLERRHGAVSGYLSTLYVGGTQMVVRDHWSRAFGTERIRAAAHAMHLVVVIALVTLWSGRRRDPAFGWLLLLSAANFVVAVPNETNLPPAFAFLKPYFVFALPAFSFMAIGLSMAVTGMPVPRWVRVSVLGMPLALVL